METIGEGVPERFIKRRKRAKLSETLIKICAICGGPAKGLHFGAMACNSCKAFFRRNVQSEAYKAFKCNEKSCKVIKNNRKMCQYCRFQKGLSVGMDVKWVMTDDERLAIWKYKIARQKQLDMEVMDAGSSSSDHENSSTTVVHDKCDSKIPEVEPQEFVLLPEDDAEINHLVVLQELIFASIPYSEKCHGDNPSTLANLFCCVCQRLHRFFMKLDGFHEIDQNDQPKALRSGISMSLYLLGAHNYDTEKRAWPAPNIKEALRGPIISLESVKILSKYLESYSALINFFDEYGKDFKDEAVLAICCVISLFYDDIESSPDPYGELGLDVTNRYVNLLRNYLQFKKGKETGRKELTRLINGLQIVKKLTSYHKVINIKDSLNIVQSVGKEKLSLRDQIESLSGTLSKSLTINIPKYSSVLTPEEKSSLQLIRLNQGLTFRRPRVHPDHKTDLQFHHPYTNKILGSEIMTDSLLPFKYKNIHHLILNNLSENITSTSDGAYDSIKMKDKTKGKLKLKETGKVKNKAEINVKEDISSPETNTLSGDLSLVKSDPIKLANYMTGCAVRESSDNYYVLNSVH